MQQDLILHGMFPRTQQSYLAAVRGLATYYHHQPDTLSEAQVQTYVQDLIEQRGLAPSSVRVAVMGVRFFSTQTRHRTWTNLPLPKRTKTLPEVLSREEVARLQMGS
jgi:site-specific recombinase XerD